MADKKGEKIKVRILNDAPEVNKTFVAKTLKAEVEKTEANNFFDTNNMNKNEKKSFDQQKPKKLKKFLITFSIILILIISAITLGFFIFNGQTGGGKKVELKLQAPMEVSSGEKISYTIKIKNKEKVTIEDVDLLLQYSYGFQFESADLEPVNETKSSFTLPNINSGDSYELEVKGRLVGDIDEIKNLTAILNYQPVNFNSNFQVKKTVSSQITDSIIALNLEYPKNILANQNFELKVKFRNNQNQEQNNLQIILDSPSSYTINDEGTTPYEGEWYWLHDNLTSNDEGEIIINGAFATEGSHQFEIKIGFLEGEDEFKEITYKKEDILVISPEINMNLELNGSQNVASVNWDQELEIKLTIENNSNTFGLTEAQLSLPLDFDLLDADSLEEENGAEIIDGALVWGEESNIWNNFLRNLSPGKKQELNFKITTFAQPANIDNYTASDLTLNLEAKITSLDLEDGVSISSNKITTTVGDLVQFSAKAFYNLSSSIQVGSGPIPPEVDETTDYKIYWYINGGNSDIENVLVKAILPPGIAWLNDYQLTNGTLEYDSTQRLISWEISELQIGDYAQANFFVSLTPESDQVGEVVTLLNPSSAVYQKDSEDFSQTVNSLDTDLLYDPVNQGQGTVTD